MNSEHVRVLHRMANESWRGSAELSALVAAIVSLSAQQPPAAVQPVAWQFQDREGNWHGFLDERHRLNTIEDGSWPVRALYTHPSPSTLRAVESVEVALQNWLDWCNEHNEEPEAKSGARIAIEAFTKQSVAPTWIGIDWAESHTHPHEKSSDCHCVQCRPLERPCGCNGCRSLAGQPATDPLVEWANRPLNYIATVGVFTDGVQIATCVACEGAPGPENSPCAVCGQQPATVDGLIDWRAAFVAERAARYREGGMAIEQARIHAETDAACIDADALAGQQPHGKGRDLCGSCGYTIDPVCENCSGTGYLPPRTRRTPGQQGGES